MRLLIEYYWNDDDRIIIKFSNNNGEYMCNYKSYTNSLHLSPYLKNNQYDIIIKYLKTVGLKNIDNYGMEEVKEMRFDIGNNNRISIWFYGYDGTVLFMYSGGGEYIIRMVKDPSLDVYGYVMNLGLKVT